MKRNIINRFFLIFCFICISVFCGCLTEETSLQEKARLASQENEVENIYDILKDYPALEAFFLYGDLSKSVFRTKVFDELLGDDEMADILVSVLDGFPPLFEPRDVPDDIFSKDIESEMSEVGALQDFIRVIAIIIQNITELPDVQKHAIYDYLDKLIEQGGSETKYSLMDNIIGVNYNSVSYMSSLDTDVINQYLDIFIKEQREMQIHEDRKFDFIDIDKTIEELAGDAPNGLSKVLQALIKFLSNEEFRNTLSDFLYSFGELRGHPDNYPIKKEALLDLYNSHSKETLGEVIERVWTKGSIIGPFIEAGNVEGYGKDGKQDKAVRELLMHPQILNAFLEMISDLDREGYSMKDLDVQFADMVKRDPFVQLRDGDGDFGNGQFYEPSDIFSYKNFSGIKLVVAYATRWFVPATHTGSFLWTEGSEDGEPLSWLREVWPTVDEVTITTSLWSEIWEKGEGYNLGHGHKVTEKRGYGMMVDGVYVAPLCPGILTAAEMALYLVADSITNGPYDNIYDNMRWMVYERKFYTVYDLVQFVKSIPYLRDTILPYFEFFQIKQLPITLFVCEGANPVIYSEAGTFLRELPENITLGLYRAGLPEWLAQPLIDFGNDFGAQVGLLNPVPGTDKAYILPQDMRDLWNLVASLSFYDSEAFHPDRFLNLDDPYNYYKFYDVSNYTYKENYDKRNKILPLIAGLGIASYKIYKEVVAPFPLTLEGVPGRQEAAREAFGMIFPFGYILNILGSLAEFSTETPVYSERDSQMALIGSLDEMAGMEPCGMLDNVMKLICIIGRPEFTETRLMLLEGLADVVGTINTDSTWPYALASYILSTPDHASNEPEYWDFMKTDLDVNAVSLTNDYNTVERIIDLIDYFTSVDMSDEEWSKVIDGIVQLMRKSTKDKLFTRALVNLTDMTHDLNSISKWTNFLKLMEDMLGPDGLLTYVILGLERDPKYSWDEIFHDTNAFLNSDKMMKYEDGYLWKDMYHLVKFLADAFE